MASKIKVDEIVENTEGNGVVIKHPLKFGTMSTPTTQLPNGGMYFDSSTNSLKISNGTSYRNLMTSFYQINGGQITNYTLNSINYRVHVFKSSGIFYTDLNLTADILIVAGGGAGGGHYYSGGGGAGGFVFYSQLNIDPGTHHVAVGAGGAEPAGYTAGNSGDNSYFGNLTQAIGGGGGGYYTTKLPFVGGSGGGAGIGNPTGASGTTNQGNAGGGGTSSTTNTNNGGGGGGAKTVGGSATASAAGIGGDGYTEGDTVPNFTYIDYGLGNSTVTFPSYFQNGSSNLSYAGGGGGANGADNDARGTGGIGGGGVGGKYATDEPSTNGEPYTGGGGGGGCHRANVSGKAGSGGSGIVIVRYQV
jgi:hypothetical protein